MSTVGKVLCVILGILMMIAGFYFVFNAGKYPVDLAATTTSVIVVFLGIAAIVSGVFGIIMYIRFHNARGLDGWDLASGIISTLIGILVLANPVISLGAAGVLLRIAIPVWTLVYAVNTIRHAILASRINDYTEAVGLHFPWGVTLVLGILMLILGIAMIFSAQLTFMAMGIWVAIQVIGVGTSMITMGLAF